MITLKNFSIGYDSDTLLSDINTSFEAGRLTALIGRNGCGKSTLLRAVAGLTAAYSGRIEIDGKDIGTLRPHERARTLAFVTTTRTRIANMTCAEVVATGRAPYTNWIGSLTAADREAVAAALRYVSMTPYAQRTMDKMSDGECQRIMIARALAQDTPVILLDEPTSFLDVVNRYELSDLLSSLAHNQGKCILFSTHELDIATQKCDSVALIHDKNIYNMTADEIIAGDYINRFFGIRR